MTLRLGLRGKMTDKNGVPRQYQEVELNFIKMKGVWYPDIEDVQDKLFTRE